MLERILRFSITHRWLVLVVTVGAAIFGAYNYQRLPIDAVPDITNVQVQINTEAPGFSPLEAEQRITFPVETAMAGLPRLDADAIDLTVRAVTGDGGVRGRHGHLLRPAAGQRADSGGRGSAAARHRSLDGAHRHGIG